ncbi:hypothetical protein Leryth_000824 [Lithospermum erythrorhizon]|nr:hypothetical protein Leryth_000824 [Lithospermum erythrorhizon]
MHSCIRPLNRSDPRAILEVAGFGGNFGFEGENESLEIEDAVRVLLQGLGEDINREGIRNTPLQPRLRLYSKCSADIVHEPKPTRNQVGKWSCLEELVFVIVRDLDIFSYCESCLLPFKVKCHVGYVPSGQRVVGLSKLSRVADVFAKRLQDPQRLADEICIALQDGIKPAGVAVVLQCLHTHFPNSESAFLDSNHQGWIKSLVSSGSGIFEDETADMWSDFMGLLRFRGIDVTQACKRDCTVWCPSQTFSKIAPPNSMMTTAVTSILRSLGEDPTREELIGTPARFVKWLLNFSSSNIEMKLNGFCRNRIDLLKSGGDSIQREQHMCSELNISFWSQCEHHLLPFHGVAHIGYYSAEGINPIGKQLLQSIVHFYGFKLQVQERLTRQIAETVSSVLGEDVMVVVEASHTCMISRGIEKFGSNTATIAVLGRFSTDPLARTKYLLSIPNSAKNL